MKLERLIISLCGYGPNAGRYEGDCHFSGQYGSVGIVLSPDVSDAILKLCADALVKNSREVAENMTAQIIEQSNAPALENRIEND